MIAGKEHNALAAFAKRSGMSALFSDTRFTRLSTVEVPLFPPPDDGRHDDFPGYFRCFRERGGLSVCLAAPPL